MNGPLESAQAHTTALVPSELQALRPSPQLLPGESQGHYTELQAAIFRDLAPNPPLNGS